MNKYHIHVTSTDSLGMNMIENIINLANQGAVLKPGTIPLMRFPHSCSLYLESETVPYTTPTVRVFEFDTNKEVINPFVEETTVTTFSLDTESTDIVINTDESVVQTDTNITLLDEDEVLDDLVIEEVVDVITSYTREQLDAMDWVTEFKVACKAAGITGRDREKMTKEYLSKL